MLLLLQEPKRLIPAFGNSVLSAEKTTDQRGKHIQLGDCSSNSCTAALQDRSKNEAQGERVMTRSRSKRTSFALFVALGLHLGVYACLMAARP
mmetsp:Transcript_9782/g.18926  ORF Transcript_9782/g.18926 Transcript_9782/m.18926 type:complete len:93 (+) Transcript_9782:2543-2821(+)